jgi:hypothetical protein
MIEVLPQENASLNASPASPRAAKLALVNDVCTKIERMRISCDNCLEMKGLFKSRSNAVHVAACWRFFQKN